MASLPPVPPTLDPLRSAATINALVREYNRTDRKAPIVGTDTGTGAAYAIAPVPGIVQSEVGQEFTVQAVHANTTTAPTLNVNGVGAGVITDMAGNAISVGNIAAGSWVRAVVTSTTPTFALVSSRPALSYLTNALAADVALNNTASFFDGPQVAQGTSGTWLVGGSATVQDTAGAANFNIQLWDGTTVIAEGHARVADQFTFESRAVAGIITNPAGNLRISVKDATSTNGLIKNLVGTDSMIWAVRIG